MRLRLALLALLVAAGCGSRLPVSSASVELYEVGITPSSDTFAAGEVSLAVTNTGEFGHTLVVTTQMGEVIAATDVVPGGESAELAVDLAPGTYEFTCRIVSQLDDGTLLDHYQAGMHTTVTVRG